MAALQLMKAKMITSVHPLSLVAFLFPPMGALSVPCHCPRLRINLLILTRSYPLDPLL